MVTIRRLHCVIFRNVAATGANHSKGTKAVSEGQITYVSFLSLIIPRVYVVASNHISLYKRKVEEKLSRRTKRTCKRRKW